VIETEHNFLQCETCFEPQSLTKVGEEQPMFVEAEIKLEVPAASLDKVAPSPRIRKCQIAGKHTGDVISVYYDTQGGKLHRNGIMFRLRRQDGKHLQTVKADGNGLVSKNEWECEIDGNRPDFKALRGTALGPLIGRKLKHKLRPLFETRVRRTIMPLRFGDSEIELALDHGYVQAGRKRAPISEAELELKRGDAAALSKMARVVADIVPIQLGGLSKAERGYRLIDHELDAPVRAAPIVLSRDMTTAQAFRAIAFSCLRQVAANQPAIEAGDLEGVHQMRIGLRRLRTALAILSTCARVSSRLRPPNLAGVTLLALRRAAELRRASARRAIASPRCRTVSLEVVDWLNNGAWRTSDDKMLPALRDRPIEDFAADEMARRRRKILKKAERFDDLGAYKRHKLRIAAKKLRYASEFFASLYEGRKLKRRRRAFAQALKGVQSHLGKLNDIAAHEKVSQRLALRRKQATRGARPRRAFAAGVVVGREKAQIKPLLTDAEKTLRDFAAAKVFWN
jgi:triphosphatase